MIPLGGEGNPPLGVEWKVGRGRVLMLAVSLTDPDLIAWPGYDTMVRRVVLRRPEERQVDRHVAGPDRFDRPPSIRAAQRQRPHHRPLPLPGPRSPGPAGHRRGRAADHRSTATSARIRSTCTPIEVPVGEWLDSAALPSLSRSVLEKASGIEIPGRAFVLKVILGYILVLVPLELPDLPLPPRPARVGLGRGPAALAGVRHRGRAGGGLRRRFRLLMRRGRPDRDPRRLSSGPHQPVRFALLDRPGQVHHLLS